MSQEVMAESPGVWSQAFRRALGNKPFLVAAGIMLIAALGIGASTSFLQIHFRKEPVPLRQPLEKVPDQFGHWVQVSLDEPLPEDVEHTLGTKVYIFRDYADTRLIGPTKIKEIQDANPTERRRLLAIAEGQMPRGFVHLAVTYYTGMVDTVAHVADRCYIADGYTPKDPQTLTWPLSDGEKIDVRFIAFEDATGFSSRVNKNVAYFFQVNGAMESNPAAVRFRLQNLFNAKVYYAKVELMSLLRNRTDAEKVMKDFVVSAMPEVRKCLPASNQTDAPAGTGGVEPTAGSESRQKS